MTESHTAAPQPAFIEVGEGDSLRQIAVRLRHGTAPGLFWLGGFNSDMKGTKALALDSWAGEHGRACVRFDYSGHGESGGEFTEGTIGRWLEEAVAVFERFCQGPQVVIGSSMGGWIALLLARELAKRPKHASVAGLVLIALAPDFTLPDQSGTQVNLAEHLGERVVVLYFYPKDNTPGCTAEACAFRDSHEVFVEANAAPVGVTSSPSRSTPNTGAPTRSAAVAGAGSGSTPCAALTTPAPSGSGEQTSRATRSASSSVTVPTMSINVSTAPSS